MNRHAQLTRRETEVAELLAWGMAKKEAADRLCVSIHTIENTARNIYEKLEINKVAELSVWWFCTRFNISFDLSPIKRTVISMALLILIIPREILSLEDTYRSFRTKPVRTAQRGRGRQREPEWDVMYE